MDKEQILLVQKSLDKIAPNAEPVAALFYSKLFEIDPSLKALFKGDMQEQGRKLMAMIAVAVRSLDNLETLVPAAQALGKRHVKYGVKDKDYDTVGTALLTTLNLGLGEDFTPELKAAWTRTYVLLANVMKAAAAG